jgi:hypothetical protein
MQACGQVAEAQALPQRMAANSEKQGGWFGLIV